MTTGEMDLNKAFSSTFDGARNIVTGRSCIGGVADGRKGTVSDCDVASTDIVMLDRSDFSETPSRRIP